MAQPDRNSQKDAKRGGDPNFNWRGVILFAIAFALIGLAVLFRGGTGYGTEEDVPYNRFLDLLAHKQIVNDPKFPLRLVVEEGRPTQTIRGAYTRPGVGNAPEQQVPFRTTIFLNFTTDLQEKLEAAHMPIAIRTESNVLAQALIGFVPIAAFLLILYFLFRQQIRMAGKGALNFGKSKARMLARDKNKITFKDVAGIRGSQGRSRRNWSNFCRTRRNSRNSAAAFPKGVLMVGPPGTGKTLLARAIAGEADVPFFSISGSDFVEMFVGVGASRVRDMFEQGKKIGALHYFHRRNRRRRSPSRHGVGGGHDEREQTLNALLVEMDGFDTQEGVIIIAATNRPDVLDPALLRPGRFDRQITVNLPDVKGREEILRVHSTKVKLAKDVDLAVIARGTPGYSGAESGQRDQRSRACSRRAATIKGITLDELEEARDKVRWGKERRSLASERKGKNQSPPITKRGTRLLLELLEFTEPLHKVTIIPRGPSLGATMWLPLEDKYHQRRNELLDDLVVIMGGRVAEEIVFRRCPPAAPAATSRWRPGCASKMVSEWGMSEKMGMVEYGEHEDYVFLGRDISRARDYSEATAEQIDREVRKLVDDAYGRATEILVANRDKLEVIAKALLEFETLDGAQIREVIEHGRLINPPPGPPPPTGSKLAPEKPPKQVAVAPDVAPPLGGGLSGAPA